MARLLVLQTFHMFYASLIAQMSWQPSSARQCADEACPEEKYLGQAVLQTTHVKEQLFDEDGISDDTADGDDAIKSSMELIHGIRVYGYHSALHADSEDDVELLATEFDPVIWIFVFTDKATDADMLNFCNDLAAKARCTMTGHPDEKGLPMDVLRATKAELQQILAKHPEVSFVEADSKVYAMPHVLQDPAALLDAESSTLPWGLDRIDERTIDSTSSYTPSPKSGSGVHVYVLDRGVRTTHSQFEGRAIPTLESYPNVRSVCSPTNTTCAADYDGHGTHCAGIVAGKDYGVAPKATIHAVAVLSPAGSGDLAGIIDAIDWILVNGEKPAVISMSVGGPKYSEHTWQVAIDAVTAGGIVVVVSAGNNNIDACEKAPAFVPSAITVGSTDKSDSRSSFSNYGTCIDIFAPGSDVLSAGHLDDTDRTIKSGTSMACPHVAGAAALILGQNPSLSAYSVTANLISKATPNLITGIPSSPSSPNKLLYVGDEPPTPAPTPTTCDECRPDFSKLADNTLGNDNTFVKYHQTQTLQFERVCSVAGKDLDLRMEIESGYEAKPSKNKAGQMYVFNVKVATSATVKFTLLHGGQPIEVGKVLLSVLDLDLGNSGSQWVSTTGLSDSKHGNAVLQTSEYGETKFKAMRHGTEADNPTDPAKLSPEALSSAVAMVYEATSQWTVKLGVTGEHNSGRNFYIAGSTQLLATTC